MSLYELNQNEIEERQGFSCCMYSNYIQEVKEPEPLKLAREQYLELIQKGNKRRVDSISSQVRSDSSDEQMATKFPGIRRTRAVQRNDLRIGQTELMITERGAVNREGKFHAFGFWQSVFELPWLWPQAVDQVIPIPKSRFVVCLELESKGKTIWHCLHDYREGVSTFVFDKEVSFLPREIEIFKPVNAMPMEIKSFAGADSNWRKVGTTKIEWQELASGLYAPKKIQMHNIVPPGEKTMDIHFTDWKIGDAVDKSMLDETEFRKIEQRKFPFDDLIKAFPEHPPAIVK
jgi:hypothetical protein